MFNSLIYLSRLIIVKVLHELYNRICDCLSEPKNCGIVSPSARKSLHLCSTHLADKITDLRPFVRRIAHTSTVHLRSGATPKESARSAAVWACSTPRCRVISRAWA